MEYKKARQGPECPCWIFYQIEKHEKRRWVGRRTAGDKIHLLKESRAGYLGRESIG